MVTGLSCGADDGGRLGWGVDDETWNTARSGVLGGEVENEGGTAGWGEVRRWGLVSGFGGFDDAAGWGDQTLRANGVVRGPRGWVA